MTSAGAKKAWASRRAKKKDIGYYRFEKRLHEKEKRGKLSKKAFRNLVEWQNKQRDARGDK